MSPLYSWSSGGRLHDDNAVFNGLFLLEEEEEEEEDDGEEAMVGVYFSSALDYLTAAKPRPPIHAWDIYGDFQCGPTTAKPINTPEAKSAVHNNMSQLEQQIDHGLEEEIETLSLSASTSTLSSTTSLPPTDIPYLESGSCEAVYDHHWENEDHLASLHEGLAPDSPHCDSADDQERVWGGHLEEEGEKRLAENETHLEWADKDVLYFFPSHEQHLVHHLDITSDDENKVPRKLSTPTEGPFAWEEASRHSI